MKKGQDIVVEYPGLMIIHQKVPGRELGSHTHKEHEIFIPLQGEISVIADDQKKTAGSGRTLYVPPNLQHSFSSSAQGEGERIILLIENRLWKKSSASQFEPTSMPQNSLVRELVFYLLLNPKTKYAKTFIAALIESFVEQLELHEKMQFEGLSHLEAKIKDERIRKAYLYISQKPNAKLTEVAKSSGLSTRSLNRLFQTEVGYTPKQFIIGLKIEEAKKLLIASNMTITDISFEVGYQSMSKFIAAFQKFTGKLPSEFREQQK